MKLRRIAFISLISLYLISCGNSKSENLIRILILSGKNNHEWQKTTPLLVKIFTDSKLFKISVTEKPDTLSYHDLKMFDVVVSNWNTWPDNELRLSVDWENDFERYIREGGGSVTIHAGASSFYNWDEYHNIGIGRWGKETHHGSPVKAKITGYDQTHPITAGLKDFYIVDEIWEKADIHPDARPLASVSASDEKDGHLISEPAVFINNIGKGRTFFTALGHDERALFNTGLETILLRAVQWTAGRSVTVRRPEAMNDTTGTGAPKLSWEQSDTTLVLLDDSVIVWQYNYNNRFGKPYFHPLTSKSSDLTCFSPSDHPWHLGLWFSWKYINGINYWEYLDEFKSDKTGYKSAGQTRLEKINIVRNPDFSAVLQMELKYYPSGGDTVMTEDREIHISAPFNDGSYYIDHENRFTPLTDKVVLDRTPVLGEPEGQSWGGYAGLSIRFSQDFTSPEIIAPDSSHNFRKNSWVYMGFSTLTGETAGVCILQNLKYSTPVTSWHLINNPEIPFFYYSPAVLFDGKIELKKGETLHLKYRVWIIPGKTSQEDLAKKYDDYMINFK